MAYLTCTKHRSYQRKHVDVCRQCPDNDACDAFQAFAATEPPPPVSTIPIQLLLRELTDIHGLVADTPALQKTGPVSRQEKHLNGIKLVDYIRLELEGLRKLC